MTQGTSGKTIDIGVISDTHGLLRPAALAALQGSTAELVVLEA